MMKLLVALLLFSGLAWVHAAIKDVTEGDIFVRVMGQSGKILIRQKDKVNTTDEIVVEMDTITEVASDGTDAGKGNKHKVNSFASQEFAFTKINDGKYKDTNLEAKHFTFESKIDNSNATLKVFLYFFKKEGKIMNGDEVTQVKKGTVKFNIELIDWQFCEGSSSVCNKNGSAVDFVIAIKSKGTPEEKNRTKTPKQAVRFNLGNGDIQLSKKVIVDGKIITMESGYPKHDVNNKKQTFTFRFPKFDNTVMYDPAIDLTIPVIPGTNGGHIENGGQIINMLNLFLVFLSLAFARFLG